MNSLRAIYELAQRFGRWSFLSGIAVGFLLCITLLKNELTTVEGRNVFVPVFFVPVFLLIFLLFCAVLLEKYNEAHRKASFELAAVNEPVLTYSYMLVRVVFVLAYLLVGWIGGVSISLLYLR